MKHLFNHMPDAIYRWMHSRSIVCVLFCLCSAILCAIPNDAMAVREFQQAGQEHGSTLYKFKFNTDLCTSDAVANYLDNPDDDHIADYYTREAGRLYYDTTNRDRSNRKSAVGSRYQGLVVPNDVSMVDELFLHFHGIDDADDTNRAWRYGSEGHMFEPEHLFDGANPGATGRLAMSTIVGSASAAGRIAVVLFQRDQWASSDWFEEMPAGTMECVMENLRQALAQAGIPSIPPKVSLSGQSAGGRPVSHILAYGEREYEKAIYTEGCYGSWCREGARANRAKQYYYYLASADIDGEKEGPDSFGAYQLQPARSAIISSNNRSHTITDTACYLDYLLPLDTAHEGGRCSHADAPGTGRGQVLYFPNGIVGSLSPIQPRSTASGNRTMTRQRAAPVRTDAPNCANIGVNLSAKSALETLGDTVAGSSIPSHIETAVLCSPVPRIKIPGLAFSSKAELNDLAIYNESGDLQAYAIPFLGEYLSAVYRYVIALSGVVCILLIIISGIQWTLYGASPDAVDQAKTRIQHAITGLILIASSYTILYIINPELTSFKHLVVQFIATDNSYADNMEYAGGSSYYGDEEYSSVENPYADSQADSLPTNLPPLADPANFCFPIAQNDLYQVAYNWADRRGANGDYRCHVGIDIYARLDSAKRVVAIADGQIGKINNRFSKCGNSGSRQVGISIDHPALGYTVLYGEMTINDITRSFRVGDTIRKGQLLGYVEECTELRGGDRTPMLHIEFYQLGNRTPQTLDWDIPGAHSTEACLAHKPPTVLNHSQIIRQLEQHGQRCSP